LLLASDFPSYFSWPTLGFQFVSDDLKSSGSAVPLRRSGLAIPYWPVLLTLVYAEIRRFLRSARARTLKNQIVPQPIATTVVEDDLPCVHCGYNLKTLQSTMRCPECGLLASDTVTLSAELSRSRPGWLRWLVAGNLLLLVSRILVLA